MSCGSAFRRAVDAAKVARLLPAREGSSRPVWSFAAAAFVAASLAAAQQKAPPAAAPAEPGQNARVLFSRSIDDTPQDNTGSPDAAAKPPAPATRPAPEPTEAIQATPAERQITFVSYDLDVHLRPKDEAMAVRARIVLRNDGPEPVRTLPLQISSELSWVEIRVGDKPAAFTERLIDSDTDHTGMLHEAEVALPRPLTANESLLLDVSYQGTISHSSQRLQGIGSPADVAQRSDWDRVDSDFVGVRGFGNVVWYPVVTPPVLLGDGNRFFTEIAEQKLRQSNATVAMRVTEEFFGAAPNLAVLDGKLFAVAPASLPEASLPGIATCDLPPTRLGFATPSLFLLARDESASSGLNIFARPEDAANEQSYMAAAAMVAPVLDQWLGAKAGRALDIVDLPEADDAPAEQGSVLFLGLQSTQPEEVVGAIIHALARARFQSPYPWLQEGVAYFMATLWVERNHGREAALTEMDNERGALSLAEPGDSGAKAAPGVSPAAPPQNPGESLLAAKDAIYYRIKATYVLWMLRDLAGDDALAKAFRTYDPDADGSGTEFERVLEQASGKDLGWFFADWVYHDRGLPDLSIAGVYPNSASIPGSYIVAVDVSNSGGATADVPVSVRSSGATVTARLRVPAKSSVTHRFLLTGQPVEVAVNDGTVPEVEASVHRLTISGQP